MKVVHCKRASYDVYIGRPSKWGNPFTHLVGSSIAKFQVATRDDAISRYREWVLTQPQLMEALPELRGKILGCWCKPQACHGDVLVELVTLLDKEAGA